MPLRIVMMGTGAFALPTFLAMYDSPHQVVGLYTQPDRTGRGHHHHRNLMKEAALERATPVFQPEKANGPESVAALQDLQADLCVVAAYGQILSAKLLAVPAKGAINVHASLLPKYRGAAPIQYAVWNGEAETGVTIFQIEPKLDAGPVLAIQKVAIGPTETSGELESRLAALAGPLTARVVDQLEAGTTTPITQDPGQVTLAPRLQKSAGEIDWAKSAPMIDCQVRAMQPWPKAFTHLNQSGRDSLRLIILAVSAQDRASDDERPRAEPGTVVEADRKHIIVEAGEGLVELVSVQPPGKRAMPVSDFLCGHTIKPGDRFGHAPSSD